MEKITGKYSSLPFMAVSMRITMVVIIEQSSKNDNHKNDKNPIRDTAS